MRHIVRFITLGTLLAAVLASTAPPAQARSCSLERVAGDYGYTISGNILTLGPAAAVGHVTLEASGTLSGAQTSSFNGLIVDETLSGTYTVNSDCTGTATINVFHSGVLVRTSNLNTVYVNDQSEIRVIFLTPGTILTVNAKKMFPRGEDN